MLFHAFEFVLVFLPATFALFLLLERTGNTRFTVPLLTLASLVFYGWWDWRYLALLVGSTFTACSYGDPDSQYPGLRRKGQNTPYDTTGSVFGEGGLSLAVGIRCAQLDAGEVRYFAGGGIVEASDPEREIAETELKAEVFRQAIATLG